MRTLSLVLFLFVAIPGFATLSAQQTIDASEIIERLNDGQDVSLSDVTIRGDLDFRMLDDKEVDQGKGWNKQEAYRYHVRNRLTFSNCTFEGRVMAYYSEEEGKWNNNNTIHNTDFHEAVTMENCRFRESANFKYSHFDEAASFAGSTFEEFAGFKYTEFRDRVSFAGGKIDDSASFKYTEFEEAANFSGTDFDGDVTFKYTKFSDAPDFSRAVFQRTVDFKYTEFPSGTDFTGTDFGSGANFKYTKLGGRKFSGR